jgi:hypothetical protein
MRLLSSFLALALSTSAALAGDVSPLSPGAPAGVKRAQAMNNDNTLLYVAIGAAVVTVIAVAASSGSDPSPTPAPTTTTSTSTV